ncbi:sugar phosphate isomerase/epimerase family protein [Flavitalea flava]
MKLSFYCTRWGQEEIPWTIFLRRVKEEGYDGVETALPLSPAEQEPILNGLEKYGLKLIGQHWDTVTADFAAHAKELEQRLRSMADARAVLITSHTGKDHFSFEQNTQLILISKRIAQEHKVSIIHETHRGKFSFAAHHTRKYLEAIPSLRLNLDISHWFTVAESYLEDQEEAVELAISRTAHIHARIGHTQGSQVPDPRDPLWEKALQQHLQRWDKVVARHSKINSSDLGFTCEFGPAPYMPYIPFTNKPATDQWEVNAYMKNFLKERYKP